MKTIAKTEPISVQFFELWRLRVYQQKIGEGIFAKIVLGELG